MEMNIKIRYDISDPTWKPDEVPRLHSSISGMCRALQWFVIHEEEQLSGFSARTEALFEAGRNAERRLIRRYKKRLKIKHTGRKQITLYDDYVIAHPDGIGGTEAPFLVECKSANSGLFYKMKKQGIAEVKRDYYLAAQLKMLLCRLSDDEKFQQVNRVAFILENRNSLEDEVQWVHFNERDALAVHQSARELAMAAQPPTPEIDRRQSMCMHCRARARCILRFPLSELEYDIPGPDSTQALTSKEQQLLMAEMTESAENWLELKDALNTLKGELEELDDKFKATLPVGTVFETADYLIEHSQYERKQVVMDKLGDEIKAAATEIRKYNTVRVRRKRNADD